MTTQTTRGLPTAHSEICRRLFHLTSGLDESANEQPDNLLEIVSQAFMLIEILSVIRPAVPVSAVKSFLIEGEFNDASLLMYVSALETNEHKERVSSAATAMRSIALLARCLAKTGMMRYARHFYQNMPYMVRIISGIEIHQDETLISQWKFVWSLAEKNCPELLDGVIDPLVDHDETIVE